MDLERKIPNEATVHEQLDFSRENGYFNNLNEWTVSDIALDMMAFSEDCGECEEADLIPLIQTWYDKHKVVPNE